MRASGGRCGSILGGPPVLALLVPLAAASVSCGGPSAGGVESRIQGVTDGPFTGRLTEVMATYAVPGVSVAVIDGFKTEWARGYGVISSEGKKPVDASTLFPASSITKAFTAAVALKLVDRGILTLDGDVNGMLKTWKLPDSPFASTAKVTLRELLGHTACINRPEGGFGHDGTYPTTIEILNGTWPATNPPVRLDCIPGSRLAYSNFGYVIVQQLLVDATGRPFPALARDLALDTLRMESSTLEQPLAPGLDSRAAFPHDDRGSPGQRFYNPNALAQGGLWTTPSDLALFLIEIMRSRRGMSERVFSQAVTRQMLTPHYRDLDGAAFWGLGFLAVGDWGIFQAGADPGFRSLMAGFPLLGKGIVIMVNGENGELLQLRVLLNFILEYVIRPSALPFVAGGLSALVLILALVVWTLGWAFRRLQGRQGRLTAGAASNDRPFRVPVVLAALAASVILGTAYPFILSSLRPDGLVEWTGGSTLAKFVVVLSLAGMALSFATVVQSIRAWRSGIGTAASRFVHSLVAASALAGSCIWLRLVGIL